MFCSDILETSFFIFSDEVPPLLYYSHIPTSIVALFFGFLVFLKSRKKLESKLLFFVTILFSCLMFLNLITWTSSRSDVVAFSWVISQVISVALCIFSVHFYYSFIFKKDIGFIAKSIGLSLIVFAFGLIMFGATFEYFDLDSCELIETSLINWFQLFVSFSSLLLIFFGFVKKTMSLSKDSDEKKLVFIFTAGIFLFLFDFIFSWQIASSYYNVFEIEQYGLFGMPIFIGFLVFLMVRYRSFNVKLFSTQAIVIALSMLIGAQLFFIKSPVNFVLTSITFLLSVVFGIMLIRSVKEEIERKEELQSMADKLALANDELHRLDQSKSEFISIASHQLRTPLTTIKGFVSLILEGSYGEISGSVECVLNKIYISNERIINLVENLLDISRMEYGRIQYQYAEVNILDILNELRDTFFIASKNKGLSITFELPNDPLPLLWIDRQKSLEIISNLIDNAIKYTPKGSVLVRVEAVPNAIRVSVKDTGIGISKETMQCLFVKFSRGKDVSKVYTDGIGLGLYVGKNMIEAQGGRLWAESEGRGKGATFFVEFPVKKNE